MIRAFLALAGLLWLAACSGEPQREWPDPSPALWEVTGPGEEKGWLFGTIHALPDGAEWRTPAVDAALDQTGLLVVEVTNLGDARGASEAFTAFAAGRDLPPLLERVPPENRPALASALERANFDEDDLAATDSWAAALLIANALRSGQSSNGVDRALLSRGLRTVALESYISQFAMFDRLAPEDQQVLLVDTAEQANPATEQALVEAWLTGNTAVIEQEMERGFLSDPELRQALLIDRNEAWIERIVPYLEQGRKPFVAVGTAHLLGPDGLVAMLEQRGFAVRRLQ